MSGVMLPGFKTGFTKIKIITISAFEPRPIDRKHLTAITPDCTKDQVNTFAVVFMVQINCNMRQGNRIKTVRLKDNPYSLIKMYIITYVTPG